jgi:UV DNA damage endonuclease
MRIRFGYVSQALSLWDSSASRTMTYTSWGKLDEKERKEKLLRITKINFENTKRMIYFNIAHGIPLYRMSSSVVPLATHPEAGWDFVKPYKKLLKEIGTLVKKHGIRTSLHPNQYTLFTSDRKHVTENAVKDMQYHYDIFKAMGLEDEAVINIHVGGAYGDKETALKRFDQNFPLIPEEIRKITTLENDDKTYTTEETLRVCQKHNVKMVFDYHHHLANLSETPIEKLLPEIYKTWSNSKLVPKLHMSSPKSEKMYRAHSDYIDIEYFEPLLKLLKELGEDVDIMIEAKAKDKAVLKLMDELEKKRGIKRVAGGVIEL